jgi:hypothetical protein
VQGSGRGLISGTTQVFDWENDERPQSGQAVSWSRFEYKSEASIYLKTCKASRGKFRVYTHKRK